MTFTNPKETELTNLLAAMLSNVSNLPMPHYVCSYYVLSMYEEKWGRISIIPAFDTLPYKEPGLGIPPSPSPSGSKSEAKYSVSSLVLSDSLNSKSKVAVVLDEPNAKKGKTVTLKTIPDISVRVKEVIIKDKDGKQIDVK